MRNPSGELEDDTKIFPVHHRGYIPMAYPLLFPIGTYGWGLYTENNGGRKTPHLPCFQFHLMKRFNHQNYLHVSNKLFQQLLVDEYERIEWGRLQWFHSCHHTIWSDLYCNVTRSSRMGIVNTGRDRILPTTHIGSNWWYSKQYKNAMTLVWVLGKPTFQIF